ncbi:MAG TPA: hypothetical protein DEH22_08675 [Chloroflexi bacterium]|nr:hypothetical protein [Chloroflexota bacterium]
MMVSAIILGLTWFGELKWPRFVLPLFTFVIVSFLVFVGEGIRDEGILGYPLVIAFAGLLLGKRWSFIYTLFSIAIISFIGLGQLGGWLSVTTHADVTITRIAVTDIMLLFLGALIYVIIQSLEHTLSQVQVRETALAESNLALKDIQTELENRITERVRHFDQARREAEAARQAIERQAWQTNGLAKLSEVMAGDLAIEELSKSVIQLLCHYLEVQVGAIFLARDGNLYLSGSYAYTQNQPDHFEIGEGLVGQAALDQQMIVLTNLPAERIQITTTLGEIFPKTVVAVPFTFEAKTVGVMVLGSLGAFSGREQQFLQQAAANIGVVFHTIQAREQIDQLLQHSQFQADELQTREEELRSANEELEAQAENLKLANLELLRVQKESQEDEGDIKSDE